MAAQWSKKSGSAQIRQRIEALAQPMPEHEIEPVDFDTRASVGPLSAKALVLLVGILAMGGAALFGCSVMAEDTSGIPSTVPANESAKQHGGSNPNQLPGQAGQSGHNGQAGQADAKGSGTAQASADSSAASTPTEAPTQPVVSVQGLIRHPGLMQVSAQTRVGEAIEKAGGGLPEARMHGINLAEKVVDGMQISVNDQGSAITYPAGAASPAPAGGSGSAPAPGGGSAPANGTSGSVQAGVVNINTADATALQTLDGVGPATAEAIIAWREANGSFSSVEQLMEVRGIGPAKFEAMKDHVTTQ